MVIIMYYGRNSKYNGGGANSRGGSYSSHNDSGRAFEYACMAAVYQLLRGYRDKSLIAHKPSMGLNMAKHAWGDIDRAMQAKLTRAAYSMTEQLLEYEPRYCYLAAEHRLGDWAEREAQSFRGQAFAAESDD